MRIQGDKVINHRGDVLAQKIYGQWDSKDPAVLEFIAAQDKPKAKKKTTKPVAEPEVELVRARDENGHFVADDPSTPEVNEAWVARIKKKVTKKK
jgi:hypothetical protein